MIRVLRMRYFQFIEEWQASGFLTAVKFAIYRCEEAIPVEKELASLKELKPPTDDAELKLAELTRENPPVGLAYPLKSRREKAFVNLGKGYRSFALVRQGVVIGDVWYVTRDTADATNIDRYLRWFGIDLGPHEVYMFDMYVFPDARGKALATYFLSSVLHTLRDNGFTRAFGYFDAHNFPALWVHRLLGYRERPRVMVRKVFVHESASSLP
ncbi:MAG TPA: GNAT family N-acetyltransferase [Geomonas sp.]|nr:GNAT family N-acetyltransferase [Geomonas sp.]